MAYRVLTPLVTAKDEQGRIFYYYQSINPVIPWLSDEQREHFLADGLVEEILDDPSQLAVTYPTATGALAEPPANRSLVDYRSSPPGVPAPEPEPGPFREMWRQATGAVFREAATDQDSSVDEDTTVAHLSPGDSTDAVAVSACVGALDQLGVPAGSGAPTARDRLRTAGHRFGNDVIATAVKARKVRPELLSRTVSAAG